MRPVEKAQHHIVDWVADLVLPPGELLVRPGPAWTFVIAHEWKVDADDLLGRPLDDRRLTQLQRDVACVPMASSP